MSSEFLIVAKVNALQDKLKGIKGPMRSRLTLQKTARVT